MRPLLCLCERSIFFIEKILLLLRDLTSGKFQQPSLLPAQGETDFQSLVLKVGILCC